MTGPPNEKIAAAWATAFAGAPRALWQAISCSLAPAQSGIWLLEAQLRLYRKSTRNDTLLIVAAGFLVALAFAPWVPADRRFAWWGVLALVAGALEIMARRLDHTGLRTIGHIKRRAWLHLLDSSLLMLCWCAMSVALWMSGQTVDHTLIIAILACSLAASVSSTPIHPATAASVFVVHAIFMILPPLLAPDRIDHILAALSTLFICTMAFQAHATYAHMTKLLRLEHERASIVADLQRAKQQSDRESLRAATAGRAKSQFLSHMNHELRTPMNAILGFSELIRSKAFDGDLDKYTEYAGIIHDSGQQLLGLIDAMLDLAKIEGGKLYLRESEFYLAHLIEEEYEANAPLAEARQLSFVKSLGRGLPRVRADERGVRQIVANLLSNALKYTPPGGCVTVFARTEPDGRVAFGVEDTGIGIAPEDQAEAFERFGKGRHDVAAEDRGVGLGLAVVKGFAHAHDGDVRLESNPGRGTRVTIHLPRERIVAAPALRVAG
ncbi:MAG TPA: HAMP domain-containing sensor histidine kinase [Rhizomicrobium sp.]|jgi:two-component system cell cycle sensor histidine kinase PleC